MSDTTVTMNEFEQIKAAMEAGHSMREIEQRAAMWIEEQKAMANHQRSMWQQTMAVQKPPPPPLTPTEPELPSAGELEACIKQAPLRWQGVVMATVTLQGRSIEAAVDAVHNADPDHKAKVRLTLMTAMELLAKERHRRDKLRAEAGQVAARAQAEQAATAAMPTKIDREMMRAYYDRVSLTVNPSIVKTEDIS